VRSHGRVENANYFSSTGSMDYVALGYNFRMPDMLAALGIAQLKKLDKLIQRRRQNAEKLSAKLAPVPGIEVPDSAEGLFHVFQMYTIKVKEGQEKRDDLMRYLAQGGIMSKVYFPPVHLTHFYRHKMGYNCQLPVTEKLAEQVLTLPMYPGLTEEIDYLASKVTDFFRQEQEK